MEADEVLKALGGWGRFQSITFLSLSFIYMRGAWQVLVILFLGADPGHHCSVPSNTTLTQITPDGECKLLVEIDGINQTEKCLYGYTYGEAFDSTILTEFDLVCDKDYMVDLASTIYMIGNAVGAVFLTPLSDRFGRKWMLLLCLWAQGCVGVALIFVHSYIVFVIIRFIIGCFNMAIALITYVMLTELFTAEARTRPSVGVNMCWSVGLVVLSLFAYLVRDWRHLQLLVTLPNFISIIYIWTLPETVPWLVSKQKFSQLRQEVRRVARVNKITLPSNLLQQLEDKQIDDVSKDSDYTKKDTSVDLHETENITCEMNSQHKLSEHASESSRRQKTTVFDLFRTTKIRRYTFIMFYLWFVVSLGYFGILFSTPSLYGNIFINLALSGAVEIPACLICMFLLEKTGRRRPLVFFMLLCGVMNITTLFIPKQTASGVDLEPLITSLAMVGKFGITGAYSTIYLMSVEIFPTEVRNQAVGLSSFFENTGGIAAPFIVYGAKNLAELPLVLFGVLTMIGGLLATFLPETHRQALPGTIEEIEGTDKLEDSPHRVPDVEVSRL